MDNVSYKHLLLVEIHTLVYLGQGMLLQQASNFQIALVTSELSKRKRCIVHIDLCKSMSMQTILLIHTEDLKTKKGIERMVYY